MFAKKHLLIVTRSSDSSVGGLFGCGFTILQFEAQLLKSINVIVHAAEFAYSL